VNADEQKPQISRARLVLGATVFVVGWCTPLLAPWVATRDALPPIVRTSLAGLLVLGIPEVFTLIAVGILGQDGFAYLKARFFRWLAPRYPIVPIGRTRHRVGVAMFVAPLLLGLLGPYFEGWAPILGSHRIQIAAGADAIFLASLFVLGEPFWEKLHRLFLQERPAPGE
jgi:hypothetical protein